MKRDDFVFTIGYHGNSAIVDGPARRLHHGKSAAELLELGLLRAAFCAALFDDELASFVERFVAETGVAVTGASDLMRLFGVYGVADDVSQVTVVK